MLRLKATQVKDAFKGKPERQDSDLPLDIRIGSTVEFDQTDFILGGEDLEFIPPQGRCLCRGYSRLVIDGYKYYRFYLEDDSAPPRDFVLQVGLDEGQPAEFILYQPYLHPDACPEGEIYPANATEWMAWLAGDTGLI